MGESLNALLSMGVCYCVPMNLYTVEIWQDLISERCRPLIEDIRNTSPVGPRDLQRWRTKWGDDLVRAGMDLVKARRKAKRKFPDKRDIVADSQGMEQATSAAVAEHKSARFAFIQPSEVFDLCCGIGGDAMSLARICRVTAVDIHPVRSWMTGVNADCEVRVQDVHNLQLTDKVFHMDPSRRDESAGRRMRMHRFQDYQPGPEFIDKLLTNCPTGAVKLGPGIDLDALPGGSQAEIELISERGTLVQAVLWVGDLAFNPGKRTATALPSGCSFTGISQEVVTSEVGNFLFAVNPAVERAGLMGALADELGLAAIHPKLGLLTGDSLVHHDMLTAFELHAVMPYRQAKVKAYLKEHHGGLVEVKTRGGAVDPDEVQSALRGKGEQKYTVFILRIDKKKQAFICSRVPG